jgi:hypothetical protein
MKIIQNIWKLFVLGTIFLAPYVVSAEPVRIDAEILNRFPSSDAYQGIAVDSSYFYTINNRQISQHQKVDGQLLKQWTTAEQSSPSLLHLDSGVVLGRELVAAHSNYPQWPMSSSIEFWDASTLQYKRRHSFGILLGSMTWIDRHEANWWGAFANYDIVQSGMTEPYGGTRNTVVIKFNDQFEVLQQWYLPEEIIERVTPMSNSGGSWGEDGYLYVTGHDHPEIYVMSAPPESDTLQWLATVYVPDLNGQGIAWDRSTNSRELWAIVRSERLALQIRIPEIEP